MKQIILFLALALTLVSCGTRKGYFSIEGRFLNLNQGEFYVYSTDGLINGIDTIKVNGGRFAREIPCTRRGTLILVFPNFSEQPIFAEPGEGVDIKADASHLKQMEVTGTDDNKLMTAFRQATAMASPPETVSRAEHFIRDNAGSPVAIYLLRKYFIKNDASADLKKAKELLEIIAKEQPQNGNVTRMKNNLNILSNANVDSRLPRFKTTDIAGNTITEGNLKGKTSIIFTWATWSYDSENMKRRINSLIQQANGNYAALGVNVDASKKTCEDAVKRDNIHFPNISDGMLFDSKLMATLGLHAVPENIIIDTKGRIIAKNVAIDDLEKYIK